MPHTFTGAERTAVSGSSLDQYAKLEIQDPDLNWVDVSTSLSTPDWFNSALISDSIDSNTLNFSASLLRDSGTDSLAPFRENSGINSDGDGVYAPMLELVRMWRVSVSVVTDGDTASYKEIAKGYIDTIDVNDNSPTIEITGRGEEALLIDCEILEIRTYSVGTADNMETVIQNLLNDNLDDPPTLYCPVATDFIINEYEQDFGNLMTSIQDVASLIGWVIRYRYDSAGVNRLTLFEPARGAQPGDEDWTIGPTEYLGLPINRTDISGVRNYVPVRYMDADTGTVQTVVSPSAGYSTSITRYKRRSLPIELAEDSQILTSTQAQALADAIRSDLEYPYLYQRFVTYGFWFVQLCDYGKLSANDVHYDTDKYGGVRSFTHEITNGVIKTSVDLSAAPVGGYKKWIPVSVNRRKRPPTTGPIGDPMFPPLTPPEPSDSLVGAGHLVLKMDGSGTGGATLGNSGSGSSSSSCIPFLSGVAVSSDFEMGLCDVTDMTGVRALSQQLTTTGGKWQPDTATGTRMAHVYGVEMVDDLTSANGARHLRFFKPASNTDNGQIFPTHTIRNLHIPFRAQDYTVTWVRVILRNMYKHGGAGLVNFQTSDGSAGNDRSFGVGVYRDPTDSKIYLDTRPYGNPPGITPTGDTSGALTSVAVGDSDMVEVMFRLEYLAGPFDDTSSIGSNAQYYQRFNVQMDVYVRINNGGTVYQTTSTFSVQQAYFNEGSSGPLTPWQLMLHDPATASTSFSGDTAVTEVHGWEFVDGDTWTDPFSVIP